MRMAVIVRMTTRRSVVAVLMRVVVFVFVVVVVAVPFTTGLSAMIVRLPMSMCMVVVVSMAVAMIVMIVRLLVLRAVRVVTHRLRGGPAGLIRGIGHVHSWFHDSCYSPFKTL